VRCGHSAFLTVRAYDCAGQTTAAVSAGVKVCCQPPTLHGLKVVPSAVLDRKYVPIDYVSPLTAVELTWDELAEPCSGIRSVDGAILLKGAEEEAAAWAWHANSSTWVATQEDKLRLVPAAALANLVSGKIYQVKLQATSRAGLSTHALSSSFLFDSTPPESGTILAGRATGGSNCFLARPGAALELHWLGFEDRESGIRAIDIALGSEPGEDDLRPFDRVADAAKGKAALQVATSPPVGSTIYATLRATNGAGLTIVVTMPSDGGISVLDPAMAPAMCL